MKSAIVALVGLLMVGVFAVYAAATYVHATTPEPPACEVAMDARAVRGVATRIPVEAIAAEFPEFAQDTDDTEHGPRLDTPLGMPDQYRVLCASMDGGSPTNLRTATDGGVTKIWESAYVAPTVGSSVNVRVGGPTVIGNQTGIDVGTTGRDGVGVALDFRGGFCQSDGAAQAVDVIVGKR